jgi:hypothetical protein
VFGIAEGNSFGRGLLFVGSAVTLHVLPIGSARVEMSRLLLLFIGSGLRLSSELLPAPRKITGVSLFRKNSSISPLVVLVMLLLRVDGVWVKLSEVVPALADRPMLAPIELLLLPLDACLPYPSCPVPAAGPFRTNLLFTLLGCGAGSVFVRRENSPNLFPVLTVVAGPGIVLDRLSSRSLMSSGVVPRLSPLGVEGMEETGIGEGFREDALTGIAARDLETDNDPNLESEELVRL